MDLREITISANLSSSSGSSGLRFSIMAFSVSSEGLSVNSFKLSAEARVFAAQTAKIDKPSCRVAILPDSEIWPSHKTKPVFLSPSTVCAKVPLFSRAAMRSSSRQIFHWTSGDEGRVCISSLPRSMTGLILKPPLSSMLAGTSIEKAENARDQIKSESASRTCVCISRPSIKGGSKYARNLSLSAISFKMSPAGVIFRVSSWFSISSR